MAVLMVLHYHKCEPLIFQRFFIISFLADSGAFVMKVSLFVFLNGELAQFGQSVRLLNGRSQVQILYSPISSMEEILYRKKVNKILLISKEIAHKLNKEFDVPFGENGISSTGKLNGRHKYYLCESRKNLSLLKKLEK